MTTDRMARIIFAWMPGTGADEDLDDQLWQRSMNAAGQIMEHIKQGD